MPSLVYVGRIRSLSPEAARALESAGFHVKNFGPGEITADECILVMTSDALLTGLEPSELAAVAERAAAPGQEFESMVRLLNQHEAVGTETAIWNRIKAATTTESGVQASAANAVPGSSNSPELKREAANLGFVPNQAGSRVLATSKQKVDGTSQFSFAAPARSSERQSGSGKPHPIKRPVNRSVSRPVSAIHCGDGRRFPRLWQPAGIGAALLVFAVILLAGRASVLPSAGGTAVEDTKQGAQSGSGASDSMRRISPVPARTVNLPETRALRTAETRRHISNYDFVAEDYTTHFDLRAHPGPNMHTPELRHDVQNRLTQKRIIVN